MTHIIRGNCATDIKDELSGAAGIASFPNAAVPANAVSIAEVLRSVWAGLMGTAAGENGIATWPSAAAAANGVSLAEVVRYIQASQIGTLTNTGGTATLGGILGDVANSSIAARLIALAGYVDGLEAAVGTLTNSGGTATIGAILGDFANTTIAGKFLLLNDHIGPSFNNTRYLAVTADMSSETWNTAATHEVLTVTGTVRMRMWITCATTLEDAADGAIISFGTESDTDKFIAVTDAAGRNGQTLTAGQMWYDTSPVDGPDTFANAVMDYVVPNGLDVGYEITGAALTAGVLVFHCVWEPLDATGAVAAGAGGAMV